MEVQGDGGGCTRHRSGEHAPLILYAVLNFIVFVIAVPFYLYTQLSSAGEKGRQKKAFAEAHGWITLRYK